MRILALLDLFRPLLPATDPPGDHETRDIAWTDTTFLAGMGCRSHFLLDRNLEIELRNGLEAQIADVEAEEALIQVLAQWDADASSYAVITNESSLESVLLVALQRVLHELFGCRRIGSTLPATAYINSLTPELTRGRLVQAGTANHSAGHWDNWKRSAERNVMPRIRRTQAAAFVNDPDQPNWRTYPPPKPAPQIFAQTGLADLAWNDKLGKDGRALLLVELKRPEAFTEEDFDDVQTAMSGPGGARSLFTTFTPNDTSLTWRDKVTLLGKHELPDNILKSSPRSIQNCVQEGVGACSSPQLNDPYTSSTPDNSYGPPGLTVISPSQSPSTSVRSCPYSTLRSLRLDNATRNWSNLRQGFDPHVCMNTIDQR